MKLQPVGNRVLVEMDDLESVTKGGIYIPGQAQDDNPFGTIIASGHQAVELLPVGTRVMVAEYAGTDLPPGENGRELRLLSAENILAIVLSDSDEPTLKGT